MNRDEALRKAQREIGEKGPFFKQKWVNMPFN